MCEAAGFDGDVRRRLPVTPRAASRSSARGHARSPTSGSPPSTATSCARSRSTSTGCPMYGGRHAGIGGTYRLHRPMTTTGKTVVDGVLVVYHRPVGALDQGRLDGARAPALVLAPQPPPRLGGERRHRLPARAGASSSSARSSCTTRSSGWAATTSTTSGSTTSTAPSAYKVAFFQDECTRCQRRFAFLNDHAIDCVYTCLEPSEFDKVYGRYTSVPKLVSNIPGYVSEKIVDAGRRFAVPLERRTIDVGYRGRPLPAYLGPRRDGEARDRRAVRRAGARQRAAARHRRRRGRPAVRRRLVPLHGELPLHARRRVGRLGVRPRGRGARRVHAAPARGPAASGSRTSRRCRAGRTSCYYRTISPRHFEAAALRVCQVLFEGRYSGVMEPMVHYIPLRKDFSNFDEVIGLIRDDDVCRELAENAYRDLIASGDWSYARFVAGVDDTLDGGRRRRGRAPAVEASVERALRRRAPARGGGWPRGACAGCCASRPVQRADRVRAARDVAGPAPARRPRRRASSPAGDGSGAILVVYAALERPTARVGGRPPVRAAALLASARGSTSTSPCSGRHAGCAACRWISSSSTRRSCPSAGPPRTGSGSSSGRGR